MTARTVDRPVRNPDRCRFHLWRTHKQASRQFIFPRLFSTRKRMIVRSLFLRPKLRTVYGVVFVDLGIQRFNNGCTFTYSVGLGGKPFLINHARNNNIVRSLSDDISGTTLRFRCNKIYAICHMLLLGGSRVFVSCLSVGHLGGCGTS